jgi:hypothetical protein
VADSSEVDRERAKRLRVLTESVQGHEYRVDPLDVADAILRRWRMDDLIDALGEGGSTAICDDQSNDGSGTSSSRD